MGNGVRKHESRGWGRCTRWHTQEVSMSVTAVTMEVGVACLCI